jgi:hypothetical protein
MCVQGIQASCNDMKWENIGFLSAITLQQRMVRGAVSFVSGH